MRHLEESTFCPLTRIYELVDGPGLAIEDGDRVWHPSNPDTANFVLLAQNPSREWLWHHQDSIRREGEHFSVLFFFSVYQTKLIHHDPEQAVTKDERMNAGNTC